MVFSWDGADAEVQAQDWDEAAKSPELDFEDELETPRPRRTSQSSKRSKDSGGSTARRRFSAEGRGVSLYSVGSGFSSASVFDRLELPSEKRPWRELLIPLGIMMFFLALVLSTALLTNSVKITVFTEGSFSYTTQVSDEATAQWVRWQRAQRLAEPTVGQGLPGGAAMVAQVTWRRLVLIYQLPQADTVSSVGLQRAKAVEDTLRALPLWQSLCGEMPISYQALCLEGDSMVSASHGSLTQVSAADVAAGVQADIRLDGNGTEELIDLETLTRIFEERSPDTLERWLPKDRYGAQGKEAFRSSFTFALNPTRADTLWRALVLDEVRGRVHESRLPLSAAALRSNMEDARRGERLPAGQWSAAAEDIFRFSEEKLQTLRRAYQEYHAHVCHASYAGQTNAEIQTRIEAAEKSWPEHEYDRVMTAPAAYQLRRANGHNLDAEASEWKRTYLEEDVVALQLLKQHHYHPYSESAQARVPLAGCQKSDRPGLCKSEFPRTQWLCNHTTVLCPCKLKTYGMPSTGRKNRLGSLHGPCNNEWLNGCAPAMLAGLRGANCDVQVPYRLPYSCDTCGSKLLPEERRAIALAAQRAQDAQTGYCADYCAKNQPMGFAEIKEFQKGHDQLHARLTGHSIEQIGKRHATRFLSDAYLKGVVRGQVECCNLRAQHHDQAVVSAERISTAGFESFPGGAFVDLVQRLTSNLSDGAGGTASIRWTRRQPSGVRHLHRVNLAEVYGHRPPSSEVWWLSPYEFTAAWRIAVACVPTTKREWEAEKKTAWDVTLTAAGLKLIQRQNAPDKKLNLKPGSHYKLRIGASNDRILLDQTTGTEHLRHLCYLQRRKRPLCPHFENSPVPQRTVGQAEHNARLTLTYFRAWTLNTSNASANVPFAGRLKEPTQTWAQALRLWLLRVPCEETKRHVGNFLSVYRVRPAAAAAANSDDSGADEPLLVTPSTLPTALTTSFRQTGKQGQAKTGAKVADAALASYKAAVAQADAMWQQPSQCRGPGQRQNPYETQDPKEAQRAIKLARAKRNRTVPSSNSEAAVMAGTWQAEAHNVARAVDEFLADCRQRQTCNSEQLQFLQKVCRRLQAEAITGQDRGGAAETNTEPLRWALHGGPGTGKSYVLNLLRKDLFEQRLGWQQGKEFQVVTFQAVNAEPLDGETIHAALGLAWHGNDSSVDAQRVLDLASQAVQWRWLVIDEISMVSAEMLARLEARCRQLVPDLSATKYAKQTNGRAAPFGGLNLILSGDLWQLPPPRGTFLGQIPWQLLTSVSSKKLPLSLQGPRPPNLWYYVMSAIALAKHLTYNNHAQGMPDVPERTSE
ncbi:unnamed protein product [Durusdinium trenchii]|uniref:ATP-dependent DNA helicase n=1 Tax=Durusdinium trenchii TaxID=1381693 RepID=A0ABP0MM75_9DINO